MQTITSAYANKMLKSLEEDKAFWVNKEAASSTYVAAINEEPVIPEYDYSEVDSHTFADCKLVKCPGCNRYLHHKDNAKSTTKVKREDTMTT